MEKLLLVLTGLMVGLRGAKRVAMEQVVGMMYGEVADQSYQRKKELEDSDNWYKSFKATEAENFLATKRIAELEAELTEFSSIAAKRIAELRQKLSELSYKETPTKDIPTWHAVI